jgi:hypothetical protein
LGRYIHNDIDPLPDTIYEGMDRDDGPKLKASLADTFVEGTDLE